MPQPEIVTVRGASTDKMLKAQDQDKYSPRPGLQADACNPEPSGEHPGLDSTLQDTGISNDTTFRLHLTFLRQNSSSLNAPRIQIANTSEDIVNVAKQSMITHIQRHCPYELLDKDLFFRAGTAVSHTSEGIKTYDLKPNLDWSFQLVDGRNETGPINIELYGEYLALRTCAEVGKTFAGTKRDEISSLKRKTTNNSRYFPRIDVELVACYNTIKKVTDEDLSLSVAFAERHGFVHAVHYHARILFAMCVHAQLGMHCLKILLDHGWNDAKLEVQPLREDDLCHNACSSNFDNLLSWQKSFRVVDLSEIGQHKDLDSEQVVPFQYYPMTVEGENVLYQEPVDEGLNEGTQVEQPDKEKARCGSGAYSEVFCVKIDPSHHKLTADRNTPFALKEFRDRSTIRRIDFERELRVLDELRKCPHPHILTHLATWTRNERYYILFPYATCNLRQYMVNWRFGPPQWNSILWLLAQFRGLADGLQSLHNLSEASERKSRSQSTKSTTKLSGWHHDLRPENILFFSPQELPYKVRDPGEGTLRIADFGRSRINTIGSSKSIYTRTNTAIPTYEPPDYNTEHKISRPCDVWSMGCIFMEVLIWALADYNAFLEFDEERFNDCEPSAHTKTDAYWILDKDGHAVIRQAVKDRFTTLKAEIVQRKFLPFDEVLNVVEDMLIINPRKRVDSISVWSRLDRIYVAALADNHGGSRDMP